MSRRRIGVQPEGMQISLTARRPILHFYRIGQTVDVLYIPERAYPGQLLTQARIDSFSGLWLGPLSIAIAGFALIAAGLVTVRSRRAGGLFGASG
jgi:hypothetical protein